MGGDKEGKVMWYAAEKNDLETVQKEIQENGVDINWVDYVGRTVLFSAAQSGSLDVIDWLLQNGIDESISMSDGKTAFDLCSSIQAKAIFLKHQKRVKREEEEK
eukprot:CAMPEP_0201477834 /NCGR_PEP_ID=MMETSP0151_2-20130828/2796_1 /ASSEMBLY_ACC=CAM_ASM_000257 /TAXON_ID=200890 /ORGANISM="Paramoeba atlantica, Strain 621/1 / CCAP 1560/9" /LENGTH=103 /DNA_ID=CAMNT_0047858691 /DNA_START=34 /DNA_END=345 /DNA_ORIENTATION=-